MLLHHKGYDAFSTVNSEGFKNMLRAFEPRYVPPDRKTITQHYIPGMYERERTKIMNAMAQGVEYYALTTGLPVPLKAMLCTQYTILTNVESV